MDIFVKKEICRDLDQAMGREWLETNGLGGFACSTIIGMNTRRYHGLLIPAQNESHDRFVALSKFEETLIVPDMGTFELSSNCYAGDIHPHGYRHLEHVRLDPFPTFTYCTDDLCFEKQIFMVYGQNTTVITYGAFDRPVKLVLRPLAAFRDYHHLMRQNDMLNGDVDICDGLMSFQPYSEFPPLYIAHDGEFQLRGDWYYNFEYAVEAYRGLDYREDLYCPGEFTFDLEVGESAHLLVSLERDTCDQVNALRQAEIDRRNKIVQSVPKCTGLSLSADAFLVRRSDARATIIAGYPWFTDWGRDTMIALPGLALVTGRFEEARDILAAYARFCDGGMIPNRFPDCGDVPEYNSVDATLWYVYAVDRFLAYTDDYAFVRETLWRVLQEIIHYFVSGTRYNIRLDCDGLLYAGELGVQLTWMDAKVGDWVVTPRQGKPVEVNALWYNALCVMRDLADRYGEPGLSAEYANLAEKTAARFAEAFWNPGAGCLYDCLTDEEPDAAIRPNQIFSLSLPHRMLDSARERSILDVVERELLTSYGLRSLSPSDAAYRGTYGGDPYSRDGAYHQGTVWAWLMGPFITSWVRIRGKEADVRTSARDMLRPLLRHVEASGLGHISEIFDGDPPHASRGCFAQAWSTAEVLRAFVEDVLDQGPEK
ncbi:MAG: glycogen debranching enzyme N-terminal domain-containing protein [Gemmatimonadetes bacterium]|nr:glycogen debranching enzyme N-terminal domain-containing protein [Gemmatimonadota bacterium]